MTYDDNVFICSVYTVWVSFNVTSPNTYANRTMSKTRHLGSVIIISALPCIFFASTVIWIYYAKDLTAVIEGTIIGLTWLTVVGVLAALFTRILAKKLVGIRLDKTDHAWFLFLCSVIIIMPFLVGIEKSSFDKLQNAISSIFLGLFPLEFFILVDLDDVDYYPAIIDIYDGIEMLITKRTSANPLSVNIAITLAVIVYYIPSFLEIYHLRFPELRNRSMFSEKRIRLGQFISSCMFLVLRVVLLFAYNFILQDIIAFLCFGIKTILRLYRNYTAWSNLRISKSTTTLAESDVASSEHLRLHREGTL